MNRISLIIILFFLSITLCAQWVDDPNVNTPIFARAGDTTMPKIEMTSEGHSFISCFSNDENNYDVRLQYLDGTGTPLWQQGGILVSNHPAMTYVTDYDMALAADSIAIIAFSDVRENGGHYHPVAYAISKSGLFLWGNDGIPLSTEGTYEPDPKVTVTEQGNVVVCWMRNTEPTTSIVIQMISPTGELLWGNGIILTSTDNSGYEYPVIMPVHTPAGNSNEVILLWVKRIGTSMYAPRYIAAQKFDGTGVAEWSSETIVQNNGSMPIYEHFNFENDENGGVFVSWFVYSGSLFDCYYQHVNSDGTNALQENGIVFCASQNRMYLNPVLAYDHPNNVLYAFCQMKNGGQDNWGILGQKFDQAGNYIWISSGIDIVSLSQVEVENMVVQFTGENCVLTYLNAPGTSLSQQVTCTSISPDGTFTWSNQYKDISLVQSSKTKMVCGPFVNNQMVVTWADGRTDNADIYAQNIWSDGNLGQIVGNDDHTASTKLSGLTNYPNPFNPVTTIAYHLKSSSLVSLDVYNLKGQVVKTLVSEREIAGEHHIVWNGKDSNNSAVASGVYFCKMTTGNNQVVRKMILMR